LPQPLSCLRLSEAAKRGRWTTGLLENAVVNIMRRLELDELYHWWDSAYRLHVDGFHEVAEKHRCYAKA